MKTAEAIGSGTVRAYKLHKTLQDESGLSLFMSMAFEQPEARSCPDLECIAIEITNKCEGLLPLAICLLGRYLYGKPVEDWLLVLDELNRESDITTMGVVKLYYERLPVNIKRCLVFCAFFPKDFDIDKNALIGLWIAHGFIADDTGRCPEDVAEEYLTTLLWRCFLHIVELDDLGNVVICRMNNLVHDFALSSVGVGQAKRVHYNFDEEDLSSSRNLRRRCFWTGPDSCAKLTLNHVLMSKFLRVLNLRIVGIEKLPHSIGELIYLRHLDLSKNYFLLEIPNTVTKLRHLQTIKLNSCSALRKLPRSIGKLINLQCLEIDGCNSMTYMPLGLQKLTSLRVLNRFVVSKPSSKLKGCGGLKALSKLNALKGGLEIELCGNWRSALHEAKETNLLSKSQLTELTIQWGVSRNYDDDDDGVCSQQFLEALQPHKNLSILRIERYKGHFFPSWARGDVLASSLPSLVVLSIGGCRKTRSLPAFGQLKWLQRLTLRYMSVEFVDSGSSSMGSSPYFPSLVELTLHCLLDLKRWWKGEGQAQSFPRLSKLRIFYCPELTSMPSYENVEDLDLQNFNRKLLQVPVQDLHRLKRLQINGCQDLKSSSDVNKGLGQLESVKYLVIEECGSLHTLTGSTLHWLTSLEELTISDCKQLEFSDDGGMLPWKSLENLRCLTLQGLAKMERLPEGLQHVVHLKILQILECPGLKGLSESLRRLTSLVNLKIKGCTSLTGLPQALADLNCLVNVKITGCRKHTSEDWNKIKNARVSIDWTSCKFQRSCLHVN